jgi:nucleotide-binding universal stress UspA family protein
LPWLTLKIIRLAPVPLLVLLIFYFRENKMKLLMAADGSSYTKKALAFLVKHEGLCGPTDELLVLNVQAPVPLRVRGMLGASTVNDYLAEEAGKVLKPIERFLTKHKIKYTAAWVIGAAANEVLNATRREKAQMIVMGTHGHGLLVQAIMGSVAQRVLAESEVPVLLVK